MWTTVLLGFWIILLVPWIAITPLSAMGFDAGYANRKIIGHAVDGGVGNYVGNFVSSWAQVRTADTDSKAPHAQWHKYVNKEYGLSFLYPDTYKPTVADNRCQDNYYRRYLLCLAPMGGSDPVISVTVVVAAPFHVSPGSGDVMPTRQRIGRHVFYCGVVGSMGVGFSDSCVLNLRGKSLQFQFDPLDGLNVNDETKQLEATMLKTLRIF